MYVPFVSIKITIFDLYIQNGYNQHTNKKFFYARELLS